MTWLKLVRGAACALFVGAAAACAPQTPTPGPSGASVGPNAPTEVLTIVSANGAHRFNVEVADDNNERAHGLMNRPPLPDNRGMLFDFPTPQRASFWMRNTPSSLDIIFIGVDGRILNIADHTTPFSEESIPAAGLTRGVLEIRAGRAAELGIQPGDRVRHRIFPR